MSGLKWRNIMIAAAVMLGAMLPPQRAFAHGGGILVQAQGTALVIGYDAESGSGTTVGVRSFTGLMSSTLALDSPSFISFSTPPAGTQALPSLLDVDWDFLPMSYGGVTSNLLYWDGLGSTVNDVEFGLVPEAGVTMTLFGRNFEPATADGSADMIAGKTINQTIAAGSALRLHAHRFFVLDDNDANEATSPPVGVYLVALQLRMAGFTASDPFYIAFGVPGISVSTLDSIAKPWVAARVDTLIRDGDYDFDGDVDASDFTVWRSQFGSAGPFPINGDDADGTRDGIVDAADYVFWRQNVGGPGAAASITTVAIPEPSSLLLTLAMCAIGVLRRRQR